MRKDIAMAQAVCQLRFPKEKYSAASGIPPEICSFLVSRVPSTRSRPDDCSWLDSRIYTPPDVKEGDLDDLFIILGMRDTRVISEDGGGSDQGKDEGDFI